MKKIQVVSKILDTLKSHTNTKNKKLKKIDISNKYLTLLFSVMIINRVGKHGEVDTLRQRGCQLKIDGERQLQSEK